MGLSHKVTLASTFATVALILVGCGNSSNNAKKQLITTSTDTELSTIDLSKTTSVSAFNVLNNVDEGLFRLGENSKVEPGIATDTRVSNNGKTYTFNLRRNAKWSNGDAVTAKDFVYSWRRTLNPKTASQYGYLFSGIKNADEIQNKKAAVNSLGVKAVGKYKLVVNLDQKIPYFKLLLGFPVFFPQDSKVVAKYGSKYGTTASNMVYNGPFTLSGWNGTNLSWTLKKNPNYWDKKKVKLDDIKFNVVKDPSTSLNLYQQKKLDMAQLSATQAKQMGNNKNMISRKQSSSYYIAFNQKISAFKNKKIRQAISMSINRSTLANKVVGGGAVQTDNFVSKGLAFSPNNNTDFTSDTTAPDSMKYNPTEARKLLTEGLSEIGQKQLKFTLLNVDTYDQKQLSEYLQSTIEKTLPQVKVTLNNIPGQTVLSRQADQNFQVTVANWFADFSDPVTFLNILTSKNPSNISKWSDRQYDSLMNKTNGVNGNHPDARWQDMIDAQNLALKEQAIVPLYQSGEKWLVNSNIKGIVYNTAGANYNYKEAYVK